MDSLDAPRLVEARLDHERSKAVKIVILGLKAEFECHKNGAGGTSRPRHSAGNIVQRARGRIE